MNNKYDLSEFVEIETRQTVISNLVKREIFVRKNMHITQKELAKRSGVSYGSIRRFEREGEISLASLSKIALALNCLEDFNNIFLGFIPDNLKDIEL